MSLKQIFILSELVFVCFLGGCSKVSGLDEQLIVYGIGVDKIEDEYELTLQVLNTQNTAESDSKEEKKNLKSVTAKAKTLIDAINHIENQTGKKILYSHAMVLVIGEETAKSGIKEIIKFFSTDHKLRPTVEILISNSLAKDIFSSEEGKVINSEDILAMTNVGKEGNDAICSNVRYLLSDLSNELKAAKTWYLEYDEGKVSCQKIVLFKSDRLTDILDEDTSKGLLLNYGRARNVSDNIKINDSTLSYRIKQVKSNINVEFKNNRPIFNIKLGTDLELYDAGIADFDNEIKSTVEKRLSNLAYRAINFCIKKHNCDIFNFYRYIINSNTDFFKKNVNQMENIIYSSDYNVDVNAKIKYMGPDQKIKTLVY